MQKNPRRIFTIIAVLAVLVISFFKWGVGLYVDLLWFKSVGYSSVFYTVLLSDLGLRVATATFIFLGLLINLLMTRKPLLEAINASRQQEDDGIITLRPSPLGEFITPRIVTLIYIVGSLVLALLISTAVKDNWIILQQYLNAASFGIADPIFGKDAGFYSFKLPFYQFIYQILMWVTFLSAIAVAAIYLFSDSTRGGLTRIFNSVAARYHLSALAAVFFLIKAWGYKLQQYYLMFSAEGAVFGPGYTDIHARLLSLKILMVIALLTAVVILVNIFMRRFKMVVYSIGGLLVVSILIGSVYPAAIQKLIVSPNELVKETPYIENSIEFTRYAYNLNRIEQKPFPAGQVLSKEQIDENPETINNIRLWDWRPLSDTYKQLQGMRPYYDFKNIDIDRYVVDGNYRQVMLAAREMDQSKLTGQAQTWINQRLKYTHGYGVAVSPVNEITGEGMPAFLLKNIPPTGNTDLKVDRPEIYYGESTDSYVIVNTATKEFDYPISGNENASTMYEGKSGVTVNSFFRKGVFALAFGDYRLILASDVQPDSQILFRRNIRERVPRIAPFLKYDGDPYLVISEGKQYWMWDAYTTTNMFPYSEPFNGRDNYIRNSVKVVVDAYSGDVTFYAADASEPVLQTYQSIFKDLFVPLSEMPDDLQNHIRYPVDMFMVQAEKFSLYHMTNPEMFYNKEDRWNMPTEQYRGEEQAMEPYYTMTRLPGEEQPEYVLIMPYTPQDKNNMIAWLAARSDGENYGNLLSYQFPKQELVYGPMQIEARINQDTTISEQLTLWDQRGSSVIRGNLLVIPVEDALLYVEPIYLQSDQSRMPELRRVIVAHGNEVVMEPTLDLSLQRIFGKDTDAPKPPQEEKPPADGTVETNRELIDKANRLYNTAQDRLKSGDFTGYGETMDELKDVLQKLSTQGSME
ncbi:MAG: UPF0182 family protein [Firmicutes bacterium]|nr:UPF0182 family protein [Bacillota bacterium]